MPIITREHLLTLVGLLIFACLGIFFFQIFTGPEKIGNSPNSFFKKKKVEIRLKGAVSNTRVQKVNSGETLWQAISSKNKWSSYVDWNKLSMTAKVYNGMEIFVPFRILRTGESISLSEIIESKGSLLRVLPCDRTKMETYFQINKGTYIYNKSNFMKYYRNIKSRNFRKCLNKFVTRTTN